MVKVSDISSAVLGFPSTNNTMGYNHVKILDGVLTCSSKDTECSFIFTITACKNLELNSSWQLPYDFISPALLNAIDAHNASSWPSSLYPTTSACGLCRQNLWNEIKHPGSKGQAYLVTSAGLYSKVSQLLALYIGLMHSPFIKINAKLSSMTPPRSDIFMLFD